MTLEEAINILEYPIYKWSIDWEERDDGLSYSDAIQMAIDALKLQKAVDRNQPLTLDELLYMDGEPLWYQLKDGQRGYGLVSIEETEQTVFIVGLNGFLITVYTYGDYNHRLGAKLYGRKPKERENNNA